MDSALFVLIYHPYSTRALTNSWQMNPPARLITIRHTDFDIKVDIIIKTKRFVAAVIRPNQFGYFVADTVAAGGTGQHALR